MPSPPGIALLGMRRHERQRALGLFGAFLLSVTAFWILKPIKKAMFLAYYDANGLTLGARQLSAAQAELFAKLASVGVAALCALGFGLVSKRVRGPQLVAAVCAVFVVCFVFLFVGLGTPSALTVWGLYLTGDLYGTLMVATLFVFASDSFNTEGAKRSYALLGVGAVLGGVLGSQVVSLLIGTLQPRAWMLACMLLTLLVAVCAARAGNPPLAAADGGQARAERRRLASATDAEAAVAARDASSSYVLAIAGMVMLNEIVSAIVDYQFTATLTHFLDGPAIGRQMSHAFAVMNVVALVVQVAITGSLLRKRSLSTALLVLPLTLLCGALSMMICPIVPVASCLPTLDSGFAYSVHQSAKESLYVPLSRATKYRAKALVDVFVMRGAKALGVLLSLLLSTWIGDFTGVRWLSLLVIGLLVPWALCALYVARRFDAISERHTRKPSAAAEPRFDIAA